MILTLGYVAERLGRPFAGMEEVEAAVVFGSLARSSASAHDVDVAVLLKPGAGLLDLAGVAVAAAAALGTDRVDVVNLAQAHPLLLANVLRHGVVLKGEEALKRLWERAQEAPDALTEARLWALLDPDPKPDTAIIASRIEEVRRNAAFLREVSAKHPDDMTYGERLAMERAAHRAAEAILDICRHLVAVHSLGLVESYGQYPQRLADAGLMPRHLAEKTARLATLRNILVHGLEIDHRRLHQSIDEILQTAEEFIK